ITSPDDAVRIDDTLTDGQVFVDNAGIISATGSGQAIDFNGVEAATSILIVNRADAQIHAANADAIRPGANATVNNYGYVQAEGGGDGIDFQDHGGGSVNNYAGALIEGGKHGITGEQAVTVYNAAGATIAGNNGSAVNIDNAPGDANTVHVTNHGTMEGRSAETSDSDGDAIDTDGLLVLDNWGEVKGLGHEGYHEGDPNLSEGVAMGGGTINNNEGGLIYGYGRAIQVDDSANGGAFSATTIDNAGVIEGGGNGPEGVDPGDILPLTPVGNEAINLVGDWEDLITNSGTIIGGVMMGGGADTLTNRGAMQAINGSAIDLGDGNDQLNLYTGSSVKGTMVGGAGGIDTLTLLMDSGAEDGTGTIAGVSGFELLAVAGGSWTILDAQAYSGGIGVAAGAELVLGNGGTVLGTVTGAGSFVVDRSDVFELDALLAGAGTLVQRGSGTTVIASANTLTGQTLITDGTLHLSAFGAIGSGDVGFDMVGGETLMIDDVAMSGTAFANTVYGLGIGDAVDFTGLAFTAGTTVEYDSVSGLVTIAGRAETYTFELMFPYESALVAVSDGAGGTKIMLRDVGEQISGTAKDDVIHGQHTVLGQALPTAADDTVDGRKGNDRIDGLDGNDTLIGGKGDDTLAGSAGDDWLHGGRGANKLIGGAGYDAFVFDTKLGAGKAGKGADAGFSFARIKDFTVGEDQVLLDRKVFKALDAGALSSDAFAIGKKAKGADVHVLYKDGTLRYDADGKGGADAVVFAKLNHKPAIDADDFLVI
ncbi:MAG: hypothetical protein J0H08_13080, partial [Rhizobiales bacterium]|nr:hypothetical protein [Hyphomicrobiales bacterium]